MVAVGFVPSSLMILLLMLGGGAGLPLGVPPQPEDPLLAKVAPEECLFYTTWAGMAEPDPNSPNQTEQLLAEPEVRQLIAGIEQLITGAIADIPARQREMRRRQEEMLQKMRNEMGQDVVPPENPEAGAAADGAFADAATKDAVKWAKVLLTSPTAFFVESVKPMPIPEIQAGLLVRLGEEKAGELKTTLERYQKMFPPGAVKEVQIGGNAWHRIQLDPKAPPTTWGVEGKYLIVGVGDESVEGILARARTDAPGWMVDLRKQLPVERMSTVTYANLESILETVGPMGGMRLKGMVLASGLDKVQSLGSVTGLDGEGFLSRTLLAFDGEPQGMLGALTAGTLATKDLEPIPADATVAIAARLDLNTLLEAFLSTVKGIEPRARDEIVREFQQISDETGIDVQKTIDSLGDRWRIYSSPSEGGLVVTGMTAVVDVKDVPRLTITQKKFVDLLKAEFRQDDPDTSPRTPRIEHFEFEDRDIYFFNARDDDVPFAPSWCLTDDQLVVALYPQNIKAYLLRDADHESLATVDKVAKQLSGSGPVAMAYCDTAKVFELVYPLVPIFGQVIMSEMQREGIDIDISILPTAGAIAPHLRPGLMTVRRTEAGIELASRQTIPGGSIGTALPMTMFQFGTVAWGRAEAVRRDVEMKAMPAEAF